MRVDNSICWQITFNNKNPSYILTDDNQHYTLIDDNQAYTLTEDNTKAMIIL